MAVMLVDLPLAQESAPASPARWVHVTKPKPVGPRPASTPQTRPAVLPGPAGRPGGVAAPQLTGRVSPAPMVAAAAPASPGAGALRLTDRGLAVVIGGFGLLMLTAVVVLVAGFLAIPNEPLMAQFPLG